MPDIVSDLISACCNFWNHYVKVYINSPIHKLPYHPLKPHQVKSNEPLLVFLKYFLGGLHKILFQINKNCTSYYIVKRHWQIWPILIVFLTISSHTVLTYFWGWGWDGGGDLWWAGSSWSFRSRWRCPSGPPECCPVLRGTPLPGTRTTPLPSDPSVAPVLEKKSKMCLWKKRELPVKCDHSIIHVHVISINLDYWGC